MKKQAFWEYIFTPASYDLFRGHAVEFGLFASASSFVARTSNNRVGLLPTPSSRNRTW